MRVLLLFILCLSKINKEIKRKQNQKSENIKKIFLLFWLWFFCEQGEPCTTITGLIDLHYTTGPKLPKFGYSLLTWEYNWFKTWTVGSSAGISCSKYGRSASYCSAKNTNDSTATTLSFRPYRVSAFCRSTTGEMTGLFTWNEKYCHDLEHLVGKNVELFYLVLVHLVVLVDSEIKLLNLKKVINYFWCFELNEVM